MEILVLHSEGWSCSNDTETDYNFNIIDGVPTKQMVLKPKHLHHYKGTPTKDVQVLTNTGKGFFCIFENDNKLKVLSEMSDKQITQLKNNLNKWQQ